MMAFLPEDISDLRRWAICVTVLAHGGIAAAMVNWYEKMRGKLDHVAAAGSAASIDVRCLAEQAD
jgi:hypothetical protein